jgi:hypothetical protein
MTKALRAGGEVILKLSEDSCVRSASAEELAAGLMRVFRTHVGSDTIHMNLIFECCSTVCQSRLLDTQMESLQLHTRKAFGEGWAEAQQQGFISPSLPLDAAAVFLLGSSDGLCTTSCPHVDLVVDEAVWQAVEMSIRALPGEPVQLSRVTTAGNK